MTHTDHVIIDRDSRGGPGMIMGAFLVIVVAAIALVAFFVMRDDGGSSDGGSSGGSKTEVNIPDKINVDVNTDDGASK